MSCSSLYLNTLSHFPKFRLSSRFSSLKKCMNSKLNLHRTEFSKINAVSNRRLIPLKSESNTFLSSGIRSFSSLPNKPNPFQSNAAIGTELNQVECKDESTDNVRNEELWTERSHFCGKLGDEFIDQKIVLCGWVASQRSHGGIAFINLRDHTGIVQVTTDPITYPHIHDMVEHIRIEYVLAIEGRVRSRPKEMINPNMATGSIEVVAEKIQVLNTVNASLPFLISTSENNEVNASEEVRMRYRHLDLRRKKMNSNLKLRHKLIKTIRRYLEDKLDFIEIETPILTRSSPEGARDYLVPSRVQNGEFYALPQSPQLFKQLLMVSGFDRYYQLAKCFRDEDLRADRQPEFTQLDMELSFVSYEKILSINEELMKHVFKEVAGITLPSPFPRLSYSDAMKYYGSDKPDLRFGMKINDVSDIVKDLGFKVFSSAIEEGGHVRSITIKNGGNISSTRLKKGDVYKEAIAAGSKGLMYLKVLENGEFEGISAITSKLTDEIKSSILNVCDAETGDLLLFSAGKEDIVCKTLDRLRNFFARNLNLIDSSCHSILWVTDFPLFEWNEEENRYQALHHPFTSPNDDDIHDLFNAKAKAYDMVYNGVEIGGGSLRIFNSELQKKVFNAIGLSPKEVEEKFGYLLEAFDFGAPPHGGIAYGVDRLAMLLANENSIREVIAFPKSTSAQCLLTRSPSPVNEKQLKELSISLTNEKKDEEENEKNA